MVRAHASDLDAEKRILIDSSLPNAKIFTIYIHCPDTLACELLEDRAQSLLALHPSAQGKVNVHTYENKLISI